MSTTDEEDYAERELRESIDDTLIMNADAERPGEPAYSTADELLNWAWTFMCNAERCLTDSTDTRERAEWMEGFVKFRDRYHAYLDESGTGDVIPQRSAAYAQGQRDMKATLTREMETMKADAAPDIDEPRFVVDYDERPSGSLLMTGDSENERLAALAHLVAQTTGQPVSIHHRGFRSRFDVYIGGR